MGWGKTRMDRTNPLVSAYCRSGQTFLCHALQLLYKVDLPHTNHSVKFLEQNAQNQRQTLVSFRNPLDAIASWNNFQGKHSHFLPDIAFWKRYYTYVLENLEFITLLDFDKFTVDLNYLVSKVGQKPIAQITIEEVKTHMAKNEKKETHLPNSDRTKSLFQIKTKLKTMPELQELLPIYDKLKALAE